MKKVFLLGAAALTMVACSTEVKEDKSLSDALNELETSLNEGLNEISSSETESTSNASANSWEKFVEEYNKDYDMIDGNTTWDGKEKTIEGTIDGITNYEDMDGNKSIEVCFGKGDDLFGKCQIKALFPTDQEEALRSAKKEGTVVSVKGTVQKKKFDEITLKDCELL